MELKRVDHVGIAVKNLEEAVNFYETAIGLKESTEPDGPIARFIEKNGPGIQHIAIRVDDIDKALEELKEKGVRLIDQTPRYGAGGARIAFVHPKATGGVLLELTQRM